MAVRSQFTTELCTSKHKYLLVTSVHCSTCFAIAILLQIFKFIFIFKKCNYILHKTYNILFWCFMNTKPAEITIKPSY